MTSKEMADRFQKNPTKETLVEIISDLVIETKTLALARRVQSDSAMASVLRELDDRYRAFSRKVNGVNPDGFKISLHALIPDSKHLLK